MTESQPELLPGLVRTRVRRAAPGVSRTEEVASVGPVARVLVDVGLAHLDRTFDYAVPESMHEAAVPGVRVKVRFAGKDVDGYLVERGEESDHTGQLAPLRRVVSAEPVLLPQISGLAAELAQRGAGVRSDVLRLAVPARHATTEKEQSAPEPPLPTAAEARALPWSDYPAGPAFVAHLAEGRAPHAVWGVRPGDDWPALLAAAAAATRAAGRGVLICVPDGKDVARVDAALVDLLGEEHHVVLIADAGPAARYRSFLHVARGTRRIVVGTRAAAFAPVHDLGLVVIWDDGDDLYHEPRAPYPHTREVLLVRAERERAASLVASFTRSVEADQLVVSGWSREILGVRDDVRRQVRLNIAGSGEHQLVRDPHGRTARLPQEAHHLIRAALEQGPVLVQTPRSGYALALACERCREPARCATCQGPLALTSATTPPACRWCAASAHGWACGTCGGAGLRAPVLGDRRTGEELGRTFPRVRIRNSAGDHVLDRVGPEPAIVVATPGAEPVAAEGYAGVVLLDTWMLLVRDDLRAEEEALRRWSNAVGLVRPGGQAVAVGDPAHPALQALVRWDQPGFARRLAGERRAAHLPPAVRVATVVGSPGAVDDVITLLDLPESVDVLGPVRVDDDEDRVVLRVPRAAGARLTEALAEMQRVRSARKLDAVRVQVDPPSI